MLGNKKQVQPQDAIVPSEESQKIHIMPSKFQLSGPKKGNKLFLLLIVLLVILFVVLIGLAILYKTSWSQPSGAVNAVNSAVDANTNVNEAVPSEDTNVNINVNADINININASDTPSPTPSAEALDLSDIDNDGLSGVEEMIFSTNANSPDTDSDGYKDEEEILLGFDPRWKDKNLEGSDIVSTYAFYNAKLLYPAQWYATDGGTIATIDTKKGDSVVLAHTTFEQNMNKSVLLEWIQKDDPILSATDLDEIKTRNVETVYKTKNGLKYYFFSNDFKNAYVLSYVAVDAQSPIFLSIFQMMANSVTL